VSLHGVVTAQTHQESFVIVASSVVSLQKEDYDGSKLIFSRKGAQGKKRRQRVIPVLPVRNASEMPDTVPPKCLSA
jgi:hypothetical protein